MNLFKYVNNERGAALLLTLFLVMFISIIGVALLNTTFYGQKNNLVAVAEQQEFYRLEGAIDMLLYEMNHYNKQSTNSFLMAQDEAGNTRRVLDENGQPIPILNKGAYFYLADSSSSRLKTYRISGQTIQVKIENESKIGDNFQFTIKSSKLTDKRLSRSIDIVATRGSVPPLLEFDPENPDIAPFPIGRGILGVDLVKIHHHQANNVGKLNETFRNILRFYEVNPAEATETLTNNYSFAGKDKHYFNSIATDTITIPAGNLVFINDELTLRGGSNIIVDGLLLVNGIDIGGNAVVNGAVIANKLSVNSNAVEIGSNAGVDQGGSGGGYQAPSKDITEADYTWFSDINRITDMRTDRE
jgi:hypothetical protein